MSRISESAEAAAARINNLADDAERLAEGGGAGGVENARSKQDQETQDEADTQASTEPDIVDGAMAGA